jgi:hypothetical protein
MPAQQSSKIRSIVTWVRGYEPAPPIGDYVEPPNKRDRWQLIAFLASIALIAVAAFIVVEFHVFNIHVLTDADATATATASAISTATATP